MTATVLLAVMSGGSRVYGDQMQTVSENRAMSALCVGAAAAMASSAVAHLVRPAAMARWAAWDRSDWYQREIAVFDLAQAGGLLLAAPQPERHRSYLWVVSVTGLGLGLNHAVAIKRGDSGGLLNYGAAIGNTASSITAMVLTRRKP